MVNLFWRKEIILNQSIFN